MYRVGWMVLAMLMALPIWTLGAEQAAAPPEQIQIQIHQSSSGSSGGVMASGAVVVGSRGGAVAPVAGGPESFPKPSQYWLGVECTRVDATLRSQLQLPEDQGLVVRSVVPGSPAAKAGIRQHDILLQAGQKKLGQIQDLIEAVESAKEQKLTLEILREGKRQKIEVKPAKRPPEQMMPGVGWGMVIPAPGNPDFEAFRKWFEKMQPGQPLRFRFFQPGFVVPPGVGWYFGWQAALPEGMSIAITKSGKDPARITVKKDGQTWEVTEKELDKLPPAVRPHVERMLGRGPVDIEFEFPWERGHRWFGPERKEPLPGRLRQELQKQLEKHQQELEGLRKQLEELKRSLEKLGPTGPKDSQKSSPPQPPKQKV